jgi:hypothetical protein
MLCTRPTPRPEAEVGVLLTFLAGDMVQVKDAGKQLHVIPATSAGLQKDPPGWRGPPAGPDDLAVQGASTQSGRRGGGLRACDVTRHHAFLTAHPELRGDLGGGHLWTRGHFAVEITSHEQVLATLRYVRSNRTQVGLAPPVPLQSVPE